MKRKPAFESEAALCDAFMAWARLHGWTPYPETADWDVLLVGPGDIQIGVQAKLTLNLKVLTQSLPDRWSYEWHDSGPDFRAILVPEGRDLEPLCGALGLTVFTPAITEGFRCGTVVEFLPELGKNRYVSGWDACWHWWSPKKRHTLPAYVPDVAAGASAPLRLTEWKIKALKVCALLELRGKVSRDDFKRLKIDPRRWTGPDGWLKTTEAPGVYERGPALLFDQQHPDVYRQVLADVRTEFADLLGAAA